MNNRDLVIHPLHLGTLLSFEKSVFTLRKNQGTKIDAPCFAWVILGGEKIILVDAGPCDPAWAERYHELPLAREPHQALAPALGKIGLTLDQIDLVVLTHLHWDHCFGAAQVPRAAFLVQGAELEYAVNPMPQDRKAYEVGIEEIQPPWTGIIDRIQVVDGDQEVMPGVRLVHLPGHTPGSMGVLVDTIDGPWMIASDTVPLYENWDRQDRLKRLPNGIFQNLFDYYRSLDKLATLGAKLIPGHDPKVLDHPAFPA